MTHTIIIIGITAIVSFVAFSSRKLKAQLIFYPPAIKQGHIHRFISYGLIHADMGHLLFNMFTLYFFGNAIEDLYRPFLGGFGFVVFYVLALIASIIPSSYRTLEYVIYFRGSAYSCYCLCYRLYCI